MRITLIAAGKCKKEEQQLVQRYHRRLTYFKLDIKEIDDRHQAAEQAKRVLRQKPPQGALWLLDSKGKQYSSEELACHIQHYQQSLGHLTLCIGGADGFAPALLEAADDTLSLGRITLPHQLARAVLLEQLYRVQCLLTQHPYHH